MEMDVNVEFLDEEETNDMLPKDKEENAVGMSLLDACKKSNVASVVELLCNKAPFISDELGTSCLHWSAYNNSLEITELLLNRGIFRDARNKARRTPLHFAAQFGHSSILKTLLQYGANPSASDMLKMTPLHWAVESGNIQSVQYLLNYGARSLPNKFKKLPVDIAILKGYNNIAELLKGSNQITNQLGSETIKLEDSPLPKVISGSADEKTPSSSSAGSCASSVRGCSGSSLNTHDFPYSHQSKQSIIKPTKDNISTLNMLKKHGIQMIDPEESNGSLVTSAIKSGQTIFLTEAGKLALNGLSCHPSSLADVNSTQSLPRVKDEGTSEESNSSQEPPCKKLHIDNAVNQKVIKINALKTKLIACATKINEYVKKVPREGPSNALRILDDESKSEVDVQQIEKLKEKISTCRQQAEIFERLAQRKYREAKSYHLQLLSLLNKS